MHYLNLTASALVLISTLIVGMAGAQTGVEADSVDISETEVGGTGGETDEVAAATSKPENIFPSANDIAGSGILQDRDEYLSERGWSLGIYDKNPGGSYIGWGTANIVTSPESIDYGGARIAAVDAAIAEAMGDFAISRGLDGGAETIRTVSQDPNALQRAERESNENYAQAVIDRVANLTTAQLDKALEDLGVDPARHADLDYSETVKLAQDRVQREIVGTALESFRGVRLLKTFEEEDAVGALVIHNDGMAEIARRIAEGDIVAIGDGVSSDAVEKITSDLTAEELIFMHGVRLLRDSQGNPVIVSFGQSSPSVTRADTDRAINLAVTASDKSAVLRANGAISDFLGASVRVDDQLDADADAFRDGTIEEDGTLTKTDGARFVENLESFISQSSEINLSGITTVRSWRANHPDTGHLYVGAVRMWSPGTEAAFTDKGRVPTEESATVSGDRSVEVERRESPAFGTEDW
ncbi:hypothetical protein BBH56_03480 [Spiribacter roseus]|uniref:DUF6844 domain-containing protein n=1 Tax=Spiribacter roseus TaxID=1855875 RepID=UPI000F6E6818|nr:hypothetical protein BBH56_03480 [Spiribacter roseus]